mgnify:CR=1 FL=1
MPITQAVPNSFKEELFQAEHNFNAAGGNVFKLALYTSAATLNSATTVYTSTNEVANSGQYTTGGGVLVNVGTSVSSGVAYVDFADISFTGDLLTCFLFLSFLVGDLFLPLFLEPFMLTDTTLLTVFLVVAEFAEFAVVPPFIRCK